MAFAESSLTHCIAIGLFINFPSLLHKEDAKSKPNCRNVMFSDLNNISFGNTQTLAGRYLREWPGRGSKPSLNRHGCHAKRPTVTEVLGHKNGVIPNPTKTQY